MTVFAYITFETKPILVGCTSVGYYSTQNCIDIWSKTARALYSPRHSTSSSIQGDSLHKLRNLIIYFNILMPNIHIHQDLEMDTLLNIIYKYPFKGYRHQCV